MPAAPQKYHDPTDMAHSQIQKQIIAKTRINRRSLRKRGSRGSCRPVTSTVTSQVTYGLDPNGNLTSDGLRTFEYGATNRLSKVQVS